MRALATPLSFAGVSGPVAAALQKAGKKLGRALYAAPAAPRAAAFPVQTLQPGSSVAVGLSSGDIAAGAVGTVTYVDGDAVWAFGHPLDAAGPPLAAAPGRLRLHGRQQPARLRARSRSYKLAAPGHDLGTLTNDAPSAVVGRLGALPAALPAARLGHRPGHRPRRPPEHRDRRRDARSASRPAAPSLTQVGPVAVAQAAYDILRGSPARQSGEMCVRITIRERKAPLRFCNTYVGGVAELAGRAAGRRLRRRRRPARRLQLRHAARHRRRRQPQAAARPAPGLPARRLRADPRRAAAATSRSASSPSASAGRAFTRTVKVHIPRYLEKGTHILSLTGTAADAVAGHGDGQDLSSTFTISLGDGDDVVRRRPGPARRSTSWPRPFAGAGPRGRRDRELPRARRRRLGAPTRDRGPARPAAAHQRQRAAAGRGPAVAGASSSGGSRCPAARRAAVARGVARRRRRAARRRASRPARRSRTSRSRCRSRRRARRRRTAAGSSASC